MSDNNELAINKPPFRPGFKPALTGLAAKKAQAAAELVAFRATKTIEELTANDMEHRIGIVFDDSISMSQQIEDARAGCEEFLRSCVKDKTAVALYPFSKNAYPLMKNLPACAVLVSKLNAHSSTPLVQTAKRMFEENNLTRAIIFSDGSPNRYENEEYEYLIGRGIVIDTVFIGHEYDTRAIEFMQTLASKTGGIFLHFKKGASNFRTAFKYLAPVNRHMLADKSFVEKIGG
jgi:Mg-chelatase subunit ChlD